MKSVAELWMTCLDEAGQQHHVRTQRDAAYAASRIKQEGLSFLTIALPRFESDVLKSVASGRIGSNCFVGFRQRRGLPLFLGGFLSLLFDSDGILRPDADPRVLRTLRQVLLLVKKVELPVSEKRRREAVAQYVETDNKLAALPTQRLSAFRSAARVLLGEYFNEVATRLRSADWQPRHAGGALATGESPNKRWSNATWTERLQSNLPWWDDLTTFPSEIQSSDVTVLARHQEPPAKMALVPKTMKGPRVIVEEPAHLQYVQQGILHVMSDLLTEKRFQHLAEVFGWLDQQPNRDLAKEGSRIGGFSTIDLSEASDRVSLELVENLFGDFPYLRDVIMSARSERVKLPDGRTHVLRKFASMGSSLCFPIESMVFYIIVSIAQAETYAIAPSMLRKTLKYGAVRVYGDDIIVPSTVAQKTLSLLEAYGLKVNENKTFTTGLFRESCGADWFRGEDVSVFKLTTPLPTKKQHYAQLRKAIEFHNTAYGHGWFLVAEYIENYVSRYHPAIPRVPVGTRTPALWSWDRHPTCRTSPRYHRPEYKTLVFREVKPIDELDGYGALKKCLTVPGIEPRDAEHLERAGRSRCVGVNNGWIAAEG